MASRAQLDLQVQVQGANAAANDFKKMEQGASGLDNAMNKMKGGIGGITSGLGSLPGPLGLAVGGITALGAGLVAAAKAAAEEQVGIDRLNQTLKNNGFGDAADDVSDYIKEMEKSAFADDELRDSLNHLVTATGSLTEAQKLQATAMDLARAKGISLEQATKLVGKVNADNINTLKRLGIQVTENMTKEQALAKVREETAGQAETYANSTAGAMERVMGALGNVFEDIGGKVLEVLEGPIQGLADFLQSEEFQGIAEFITGVLGAAFTVLGTAIGVVFDVAKAVIGPIIEFIKGAGEVVKGIWDFFTGGGKEAIEQVPTDVKTAVDTVATDLPAGFETAADGAIAQVERIPIAVRDNIKEAASHFQSLEFKVEATPSAVIQPIPQDELDRHSVYIASMLEQVGPDGNPIDISVAVSTSISFGQIAIPEDDRAAFETRIEELIQSGVSAQQAEIIVEREIQLKANVAQAVVDNEQALQRVHEALEAGGLRDSPINVDVTLNPNYSFDSEQPGRVLAKAQEAQEMLAAGIAAPFTAALNFTLQQPANLGEQSQQVGQNVMEGMATGLENYGYMPVDGLAIITQNVIDQANTILRSHSPSQVFHEIGQGIDQGLSDGIEAGGLATTAIGTLVGAITNTARTALTIANFSPFGALVNAGIAAGIGGGGGGSGADMLAAGARGAVGAASSLAAGVRTQVATADDNAVSIGNAVAQGLAAGITAMAARAAAAARKMVTDAINAAKNAAGIASPSTVMYDMAGEMIDGWEDGWKHHSPRAAHLATQTMYDVKVAMTTAADATMPEAGGYMFERMWGGAINAGERLPADDMAQVLEERAKMAMDASMPAAGGYGAEILYGGINNRLSDIPEDDMRQIIQEKTEAALAVAMPKAGWYGAEKLYEEFNLRLKDIPEDDIIQAIDEIKGVMGHEWGYGFDPTIDLCDDIEEASEHAYDCAHQGGHRTAQEWIDGFNERMATGEVNVGPYQSGEAYDPGGRGGGSGGSGRRAMAAGGSFWTTGPTNLLVGEAGREFVSVTPQGQMGPGGIHIGQIVINAGLGANGRQIADELSIELRRLQGTQAIQVRG